MTKVKICYDAVCSDMSHLAIECATFDIYENTITLGLSNQNESCHIELGLTEAAQLYATLFNAFKDHKKALNEIMNGGA